MSGWLLAIRALANIITLTCIVWLFVRYRQYKYTRMRYQMAIASWGVFWFGVNLWLLGFHF